MKLSEAATKSIELSAKVLEYYERELPKFHPNYPLINPDDSEPAPPPEEAELREFLEVLSPETIYQLYLIKNIGCYVYKVNEMNEHYQELLSMYPKKEWTLTILARNVTLADDLRDGIEILREAGFDVDTLPLPKPKKRSVQKR